MGKPGGARRVLVPRLADDRNSNSHLASQVSAAPQPVVKVPQKLSSDSSESDGSGDEMTVEAVLKVLGKVGKGRATPSKPSWGRLVAPTFHRVPTPPTEGSLSSEGEGRKRTMRSQSHRTAAQTHRAMESISERGRTVSLPEPPCASKAKVWEDNDWTCSVSTEPEVKLWIPTDVIRSYLIPWLDYPSLLSCERVCKVWRCCVEEANCKDIVMSKFMNDMEGIKLTLENYCNTWVDSIDKLSTQTLKRQITTWKFERVSHVTLFHTIVSHDMATRLRICLRNNHLSSCPAAPTGDSAAMYHELLFRFFSYRALTDRMNSLVEPLEAELQSLLSLESIRTQSAGYDRYCEGSHQLSDMTVLGSQGQVFVRSLMPATRHVLLNLIKNLPACDDEILPTPIPIIETHKYHRSSHRRPAEAEKNWMTRLCTDHVMYFLGSITKMVISNLLKGFIPLRFLLNPMIIINEEDIERVICAIRDWEIDIIQPAVVRFTEDRQRRNTYSSYLKATSHIIYILKETRELVAETRDLQTLDPESHSIGEVIKSIREPLLLLEADQKYPNLFSLSARRSFEQLRNRAKGQLRHARQLLLQKRDLETMKTNWEQAVRKSFETHLI